MAKSGIEIESINYQENGNWAFTRKEEHIFHVHLYGRTKNSKKQKWGQALYLPYPDTHYYDDNEKTYRRRS